MNRWLWLPVAVALLAHCAHHAPSTQSTARKSEALATALKLGAEDFKTLDESEITAFKVNSTGPFTHALFGYIDPEDPDSSFQVSPEVPLKVGVYYGWALKLVDGAPNTVTVGETLQLPEPARIFRINTEKSQVSEDGSTVSSRLKLSAEDGWLFNFWQLTPGDPYGEYRLDLDFESQPVVSFSFKVVR